MFKDTSINLPMLMRVVGWLLMIEAAFMLVPFVTCLIYRENDYEAFLLSIIITVGAGALMTFGIHPKRHDMGKREGFLLTALVWVIFSAFGMIPFMRCHTPMPLSDAFFEAMSGFTTTGASILEDMAHLSHGIIMWRCLMQWIGGMGIILFTVAVLPMLNSSGGMAMFNAEVTGITREKLRPRVSQTAMSLWQLYITLTVLLMALLWIGPMNLFEAVCHGFSTISTGGFSTENDSIAAFSSVYIDVVVTVFMFLGGVNFALLVKAASGKIRSAWSNDVLRTYVGIIAVMMVLFVLTIIINGQAHSWEDVTIAPLFQIVSTMTSTGYTVSNFESWGAFVLSLVFAMMFFGACAGSTSGGAKIDRLIFLQKYVKNELRKCVHPRQVYAVRVGGKVMPSELVAKVVAFLCFYVILIMAGGVALTALNIPLVDSFFSSFSAISNTGLGAGVTGYGSSYEIIPAAGKWILSFLMLVGRLEIFTVLILFTSTFWKK
ncbi:MAG: TrkH family potassium uptake protein [Bacteroidales bacterium]|nr:TrkH family potassium uptake protein [Bacteroidales bacterium]